MPHKIVAVLAIGALIIGAALALTAYRRGRLHATTPNVILIVLDTLRADRLAAYGNTSRVTPFLDHLAAESVVYERAYSTSSWTIPSVASLFLAQYPSEHQSVTWRARLREGATTLATVLRDHGFRTAGFSGNLQVSRDNGFDQGFEEFRLLPDNNSKTDAADLNRDAMEWVAGHANDRVHFFLYLQYMEPHAPYRPHPGITAERDSDLPSTDNEVATRLKDGAIRAALGRSHPWDFTPAEVHRLQQLYDGEVTYLDRQLADLFAALEQHGALRDTLVIVTADHGEEFGEHQVFAHGVSLFEPAVRVPLIIRRPDRSRPSHVREPVELSGLAPALLTEFGIGLPASFHVPPLPLGPPAGRPATLGSVFCELPAARPDQFRTHQSAVIVNDHKLSIAPSGERWFYDLTSDPGETRPLNAPPFSGELSDALARFTQGLTAAPKQPPAAVDDATRERLRSLGYAQ